MKSNCCNSKIKIYNEHHFCSNCLKIIKLKKYTFTKTIFVISIFAALFVSINVFAPGHLLKRKFTKSTDLQLNDSTILSYMNEIEIVFPEVVLAQIHLESGHYKSKICRLNHNLLGIKYIGQKESTGENLGHAVFPTYKACLRDYKRLQKYYLGNLARKYAEDSSYQQRLVQIQLSR